MKKSNRIQVPQGLMPEERVLFRKLVCLLALQESELAQTKSKTERRELQEGIRQTEWMADSIGGQGALRAGLDVIRKRVEATKAELLQKRRDAGDHTPPSIVDDILALVIDAERSEKRSA